MTFQQLRYLLEVHRTGSISKAADNLYVSRPSVSFCINSLEEEVGYPIFLRTRQGLVPSKLGQQFLNYANRIYATYQLMGNIGQESTCRKVHFSICSYLPVVHAVSDLLREYPNRKEVGFSFRVNSVDDIMELLSQFELDLAVFARFKTSRASIEAKMEKRDLHWQILGTIPTVIQIGPGHRLYEKEDLTPKDLENDTLLDTLYCELSRNKTIRKIINIPPECVIPCTDSTVKHELIEKGLGYTIGRMPPKQTILRKGLRCIPIEELEQPLYCAFNSARPLAPEASRFIALVQQQIALDASR